MYEATTVVIAWSVLPMMCPRALLHTTSSMRLEAPETKKARITNSRIMRRPFGRESAGAAGTGSADLADAVDSGFQADVGQRGGVDGLGHRPDELGHPGDEHVLGLDRRQVAGHERPHLLEGADLERLALDELDHPVAVARRLGPHVGSARL